MGKGGTNVRLLNTMIAYIIARNKERPRIVDAKCRFNLPCLGCLVCTPEWKSWGQSFVGYPAFKFDFLNEREFNFDRIVDLRTFGEIRKRLVNAAGRDLVIEPGAGIGELEGTAAAANLDDFTWGRFIPEISKRARDLLARGGVDLLTAECSIMHKEKKLKTHLAIQCEPIEMLTKESLNEHHIVQCSRCGNYLTPSPRKAPTVPAGYLIKRTAWPPGIHLVQVRETTRVLASQQFIEAVKRHNLTGIAIEQYGRYV
jgi:hypothetical protein